MLILKAGVRDFCIQVSVSTLKSSLNERTRFWSASHAGKSHSLLVVWKSGVCGAPVVMCRTPASSDWFVRAGGGGVGFYQDFFDCSRSNRNSPIRGLISLHARRGENKVPHYRFNVLCIVVFQLPKIVWTLWSALQKFKDLLSVPETCRC